MFTAVLFTIAKIQKQPQRPSTDEWIKIWYIYTMENYSAIKKNEILPFTTPWMDLEGIMLSEINQTEKDKYHLYVESKKYNKLVNIKKRKEGDSQIQRTNQQLPVGRGKEQYRGRELRGTNDYVQNKVQGYILQNREHSQYFIITTNRA